MRCFAILLLFLGLPSAAFPQAYTVLRIPEVPIGGTSTGYGISNDGTVVGQCTDAAGNYHAFSFNNGNMNDLGLGTALAISRSGDFIAGLAPPWGNTQAFIYSNGVVTDLGSPGTGDSIAYAVNDSGTLAGVASPDNATPDFAFSFSNESITVLGALPGDMLSHACGINNAGTIVGYSEVDLNTPPIRAFSYSNGVMTALGTIPGAAGSIARAINDSGTIVGSSWVSNGYWHALRWSNGVVTDLGTLGGTTSEAMAINSAGIIVGDSLSPHGQEAFVYTGGVLTSLNTLVTTPPIFQTAPGINDSGQIIVQSANSCYLLTPIAPPPNQTITFSDVTPDGTYAFGYYRIVNLNAVASSGLTPTFTVVSGPGTVAGNVLTITGAGIIVIQASQSGGGGYNAAQPVVKSLTIPKGDPGLTWNPVPGLSYGTPLSSSQLDAYANVPGTFVYSQPVGMLFPVGSTTVSVTFTPTDQADYNTATASVTIRVLKGTPQIAWPSPSPIVFGTALSGAQLDAVANVPGTLSYNHAAGDILPPGNQSIQVTFVPTDTADYNNAYASVTLTVANQVSFYVSEGPANSITSLTARGNTTTYSSSSSLSGTNGIAIDSAGNLYVANGSNYTIAKIAPSGSVSVVAANGLNFPVGLAIDTSGNLFVANYGNNTIAKVATGGLITGFVNSGLSGPAGLAFDPQGNLYEADSGSGTVLKISVGAGVSVFVRGLVEPSGLVFDSLGNLFVSDTGSGVIYKVASSGSTRVFASGLNVPVGLACDPANTIYVVESGTGRILSVTSSGVVSVFASGLTVNDPQFIVAVPSPPFFTATPASLSVATGQPAALAVTAFGIPAPTYQWNLGGTPIAGATDPILLVNPALAGSYTCTSDNAAGSATSPPCVLSIIPGSIPGYLSNLSARGDVGAGGNMLIGGFAIPPQGQKNLLVRAVGPGLVAAFGVAGELPASQVTLYDSNQLPVVSNTGWANPPVPGTSPISVAARTASAVLMAQLGAFALAAGSTDSALAVTTAPGSYTAQMGGLGGGTGIGLFEIYDADSGIPTSHLVNISARAAVGSGGSILIGGFYIAGSAPDTLLIRGVGPGLALKFGLTGTLAQPVLSLFDSRENLMVSNTGWGGDLTLTAVSGLVGAFSLSANSSDSVLLVTLPPGGYTAQLSGVNGSTGIGLLEIYEVP